MDAKDLYRAVDRARVDLIMITKYMTESERDTAEQAIGRLDLLCQDLAHRSEPVKRG